MKVRVIIEDRSWEYQLRVKQQLPGRYYVELCARDGAALKPSVFTGTLPSLDVIVASAHALYLQLTAMRLETRHDRSAVAIVEGPVSAQSLTGDPAIDRHLV